MAASGWAAPRAWDARGGQDTGIPPYGASGARPQPASPHYIPADTYTSASAWQVAPHAAVQDGWTTESVLDAVLSRVDPGRRSPTHAPPAPSDPLHPSVTSHATGSSHGPSSGVTSGVSLMAMTTETSNLHKEVSQLAVKFSSALEALERSEEENRQLRRALRRSHNAAALEEEEAAGQGGVERTSTAAVQVPAAAAPPAAPQQRGMQGDIGTTVESQRVLLQQLTAAFQVLSSAVLARAPSRSRGRSRSRGKGAAAAVTAASSSALDVAADDSDDAHDEHHAQPHARLHASEAQASAHDDVGAEAASETPAPPPHAAAPATGSSPQAGRAATHGALQRRRPTFAVNTAVRSSPFKYVEAGHKPTSAASPANASSRSHLRRMHSPSDDPTLRHVPHFARPTLSASGKVVSPASSRGRSPVPARSLPISATISTARQQSPMRLEQRRPASRSPAAREQRSPSAPATVDKRQQQHNVSVAPSEARSDKRSAPVRAAPHPPTPSTPAAPIEQTNPFVIVLPPGMSMAPADLAAYVAQLDIAALTSSAASAADGRSPPAAHSFLNGGTEHVSPASPSSPAARYVQQLKEATSPAPPPPQPIIMVITPPPSASASQTGQRAPLPVPPEPAPRPAAFIEDSNDSIANLHSLLRDIAARTSTDVSPGMSSILRTLPLTTEAAAHRLAARRTDVLSLAPSHSMYDTPHIAAFIREGAVKNGVDASAPVSAVTYHTTPTQPAATAWQPAAAAPKLSAMRPAGEQPVSVASSMLQRAAAVADGVPKFRAIPFSNDAHGDDTSASLPASSNSTPTRASAATTPYDDPDAALPPAPQYNSSQIWRGTSAAALQAVGVPAPSMSTSNGALYGQHSPASSTFNANSAAFLQNYTAAAAQSSTHTDELLNRVDASLSHLESIVATVPTPMGLLSTGPAKPTALPATIAAPAVVAPSSTPGGYFASVAPLGSSAAYDNSGAARWRLGQNLAALYGDDPALLMFRSGAPPTAPLQPNAPRPADAGAALHPRY